MTPEQKQLIEKIELARRDVKKCIRCGKVFIACKSEKLCWDCDVYN